MNNNNDYPELFRKYFMTFILQFSSIIHRSSGQCIMIGLSNNRQGDPTFEIWFIETWKCFVTARFSQVHHYYFSAIKTIIF